MRCPFCNDAEEKISVIDSRTCEGGKAIRRRRECDKCAKRFTTYERVEQTTRLMVIKKDGKRVPFDKDKILAGLERACYKRPVPESELLRVADEVEDEAKASYEREVPSTVIGQLVIQKLRRLDQVAYVRFASVYRQFKTLDDLVDEAKAVLDARRFEDPEQGRLFIEPPAVPAPRLFDGAAAGGPTNGAGGTPARVRKPGRPRMTRVATSVPLDPGSGSDPSA